MQIIPSNQKIVEKILRDKNGQLVRATFCVYECAGHIKGRLIKAELIEKILQNKKVAVLTGFVQNEFKNFIEYVNGIVSPYFIFNQLYFSGSKPRAPTL